MGQRTIRVNELVKREISDVLHTRYQQESVYVTVTDVQVAPDLRNARVYYSVLGGGDEARAAHAFFRRNGSEIRRQVGRHVVLKYLPNLSFIEDDSLQRGDHLNQLIDELGLPEAAPGAEEGEAPAAGGGGDTQATENPRKD